MKKHLQSQNIPRAVAQQVSTPGKKKSPAAIRDLRPKDKVQLLAKHLQLPHLSGHEQKPGMNATKEKTDQRVKQLLVALLNNWANESLSATRSGVSVKAKGNGNADLVQGWLKITKGDIAVIETSVTHNELAKRLLAATGNAMPDYNEAETVSWISEHKDWLWEKIAALKKIVETKIKVKMPVRKAGKIHAPKKGGK